MNRGACLVVAAMAHAAEAAKAVDSCGTMRPMEPSVGEQLLRTIERWDLDVYEKLLADSAIEGRPQLHEHFRGRVNIMGMYRSVPSAPTVRWSRVVARQGLTVGQGTIDYGDGSPSADHLVAVVHDDGRSVASVDFYFAPPLPPIPYHQPWSTPDPSR